MNDPQNLNWTLINEMAAALTPEQRDQAEWRIRNTGKLPMGDFEVSNRSVKTTHTDAAAYRLLLGSFSDLRR
jgi:hypothetical protein